DDAVFVPVGDARGVDGQLGVALGGAGQHAPALAGRDREVVLGTVVEPADGVFLDVGVTDGVAVIDLVAAPGEDAALIDLDDVSGALQHPLDAAALGRFAVAVAHRGDDHDLGAGGAARRAERTHF